MLMSRRLIDLLHIPIAGTEVKLIDGVEGVTVDWVLPAIFVELEPGVNDERAEEIRRLLEAHRLVERVETDYVIPDV